MKIASACMLEHVLANSSSMMSKAKGRSSIFLLLLVLSAAIADSFIYEFQRYPYYTFLHLLSVPPTALLSCFSMELDRNYDMEFVEDYEHIHPDIAGMLLTKATCQNDSFVVDPDTLTVQRGVQRGDGLECSTSDVVSIDLLAGLAEVCDSAVFDGTTHDNLPKKLLGLINLSQFPTPSSPEQINDDLGNNFTRGSPDESSGGNSPAILVATMIALNLLESSIRSIVVGERRGENSKDHHNFTNKSNHNNARSGHHNSDLKKGAPLLRNMIQEISMNHFTLGPKNLISASDLAPILRALLLPTKEGGINLRNLVSHGFLSTIQRRWFSLTLVLIQTLDCLIESNSMNNDGDSEECADDETNRTKGGNDAALSEKGEKGMVQQSKSSLTKYPPMASQVHSGKGILLQDQSLQELELQMRGFVSLSHVPLLRFGLYVLAPTLRRNLHTGQSMTAFDYKRGNPPSIPSLTAIFSTVICSLLEHSLRLLWSSTNNIPNSCIARPSEYYVTLDGHGQRDKHEVMVSPYLQDGRTRNQLLPVIGAQSCAMLSDLFAAPSSEAPNIRSALFHGTWEGELVKELKGLTEKSVVDCPERSNPLLVDAACALVSCLDLISSDLSDGEKRISSYRPVYTFTASVVRNLNAFLHNLAELDALISNNSSIGNCIRSMETLHPKLIEELRPLKTELKVINKMACDLFPSMRKSDDKPWGVEDIYSEHQTNVALASNVAALTLLSDASHALENYLAGLYESIDKLSMEPRNTKDHRTLKTSARFCSAAMIVRDFYPWTVYVALLQVKNYLHSDGDDDISNREDVIRATERSRMVLSTVDSYLKTNLDRSLKALQQYIQGKVVKNVILQKIKLMW